MGEQNGSDQSVKRRSPLEMLWNMHYSCMVGCGVAAVVAVMLVVGVLLYHKQQQAMQGQMPMRAIGDIGAMNSALALYQVDVNSKTFPRTLRQLLTDNAAGWSGPYMAAVPIDPWGNNYRYSSDGASYTLQAVHIDVARNRSETIRYCSNTGMMETLP